MAIEIQRIRCPECDFVQDAKIVVNGIWSVFVHECTNCGYIIMESEWQEFKSCGDDSGRGH